MKRRFTILTAAFALLAFLAIPMGMWGQTRAEVVSYTLEPVTGSNNSYTGNCDITIDGITWNLTGNSQQIPWRIGGKSISNVDRPLYSKTAISDNISKIEVAHGAASSITVNSWTVIVASDASFTNVVSTLTPTFAANATTTINRPTGADWSNCYYKFVYNVSVSGNTNRYVQFTQAKFYKEEGTGPVIATPTFSPVGGDYTTAQNVTISCETQGATIYYTTDGSTPDNTSTQYTTAIPVSSTTTINAIAYVGTDASSVATATYNIVQPLATMQAIFDKATEVGTTATYVYITLDNWVVSGVSTNGKNVFVTDGTKGFVIFDNGANMGFTAGDVLSGTVYCKVQLYNGFAELTQLNSTTSGLSIATGGTVTAADVAMADLAGVNTGALVHYDNLTCSVDNNKYYLSDGTTTLQVYNAIYAFGSTFVADHIYNITGVYQQYNTTKEVLPRSADDIEEVVSAEPSVTVTPNTINAPAEGADGTLVLAYENITNFYSFDFYFCDAQGEELQEDPDWIYAEIIEDSLYYLIDANNGSARMAYMKVYTFDDEEEEVYAIVIVSQEEYVAPTYAELPFEFNGGKTDIENTDGLYQEGLGNDYNGGNNATTPLKFDNTGDWLLLQFNERPGTLTFDITGNTFSGGTFTVQTSEDGVTYTDLATYTELGATQNEEFSNLGANVRYIKWIYTNKSSGNVGLGSIALSEYVAPQPAITLNSYLIEATAAETEGTLTVTYTEIETDLEPEIYWFESDGVTSASEPDWMSAEINTELNVEYLIEENEGAARTAYFKVYGVDAELNDVYSNLVTVTQAAAPQQYMLTVEPFENLELITFVNDEMVMEGDGEIQVNEGDQIMLSIVADPGYVMETLMVNNVNHVNDIADDFTYTFDMPAENVTISATAVEEVPPTPGTWVLTSLADLTEDDIFVIVGTDADNEATYALPNYVTTSAPVATSITVANGTLSEEPAANLQWNMSGNATDGYTFYVNGDHDNWLYCNTNNATGSNNNMRVGPGVNVNRNVFVLDDDDYLITNDDKATRYLSIYFNGGVAQDWRGYVNTNNGALPISFYKKVEAATETYTLDINGYPEGSDGGYCLIASPVTVDPATVEGLTEGEFDLYYFDESQEQEWINYIADEEGNINEGFGNITPGKGYLYAKQATVEGEIFHFTLTGTPYNGEPIIMQKTGGTDWSGWNLVGNPYGQTASIDRDYYTMNNLGTEIVLVTGRTVQAMEGIFVIAAFDGEEMQFNPEATPDSGEKIIMNVSNAHGSVLDRAAIRFGEGNQLPKFMLNENSTKLYITEGEEEFAVVRSINESSTPVSFRAAENGAYTLSINTENVDMEYFHLIDNMTGTDVDLLATPSYSFEANTTDNASRFTLVYATTTSVNENNTKHFAFFNGSEWMVNNEGEATLQVVDVTGRVISTETLNGNATISLNQVSGVYMFRLMNGNDVKVQKVVVK